MSDMCYDKLRRWTAERRYMPLYLDLMRTGNCEGQRLSRSRCQSETLARTKEGEAVLISAVSTATPQRFLLIRQETALVITDGVLML